MGKKKTPFKDWETKTSDGTEKRYIRMGVTQMADKAIKDLTPSAFKVYCYMKLESAGKIEFIFPRSKYRDFLSAGGFNSAKKELIELGFIEEVENNKHRCKANIYRFSTAWKFPN